MGISLGFEGNGSLRKYGCFKASMALILLLKSNLRSSPSIDMAPDPNLLCVRTGQRDGNDRLTLESVLTESRDVV